MSLINIRVDTRGAERKLSRARIRSAMGRAMDAAVGHYTDTIKWYPPKPPQSTYVRTGTLGRGWQSDKQSELRWFVRNRVFYASFVQGETQRPLFRRIGWRNPRSAATVAIPRMLTIFRAELARELRRS